MLLCGIQWLFSVFTTKTAWEKIPSRFLLPKIAFEYVKHSPIGALFLIFAVSRQLSAKSGNFAAAEIQSFLVKQRTTILPKL